MYDIHTHVVPRELFAFDGDRRWPAVRDYGHSKEASLVVGDRITRRLDDRCWNPARRLADMDADGVEVQVLSPLPDLLAYWAEPAAAAAWCTWMNEWLAALVDAHPSRFAAFGIVPAQDVDRACDQLTQVAALKLSGIELGTDLGGTRITDPSVEPLLGRAAELGLIVFVHANDISLSSADSAKVAKEAAYPIDVGAAVAGLIARGMFSRWPGLRLVASHGAGVAPLAMHRLEHAWQRDEEVRSALPVSPRVTLRSIGCDSLTFDPGALRYALEVMGSEAVMVGSDYPFHDRSPGGLLAELGLSDHVRARVAGRNAATLLGWQIRPGAPVAEGARA